MIAHGVAEAGFRKAAASGLIDIGKRQWNRTVDYVVIILGKVVSYSGLKIRQVCALGGAGTENMNIFYVRVAFSREYFDFWAERSQAGGQLEYRPLGSAESNVRAFCYDGYFHNADYNGYWSACKGSCSPVPGIVSGHSVGSGFDFSDEGFIRSRKSIFAGVAKIESQPVCF